MNSREAPTNSQVAVPNGAPTWDNDGTFIAPRLPMQKSFPAFNGRGGANML
jgi:hypothetical protein